MQFKLLEYTIEGPVWTVEFRLPLTNIEKEPPRGLLTPRTAFRL